MGTGCSTPWEAGKSCPRMWSQRTFTVEPNEERPRALDPFPEAASTSSLIFLSSCNLNDGKQNREEQRATNCRNDGATENDSPQERVQHNGKRSVVR